MEHLFVYGTLRHGSGHPLARLLATHARFVGRARFTGRLFDLGAYPAAVPAPEGGEVVGELYRLLAPEILLPLLDRYEGCTEGPQERARDTPGAPGSPGGEYRRERLPVRLEHGGTREAWIYLYNRPTERLRPIPGGDYLSR
jgi:gamma-glutamylcyclotransferase (GGCT)/AIG2-like uncharacterized protein YtfP